MFDALSDKLQNALGDLKGRGTLDDETITRAMREVRLALLEADVNFDVVKQFVAQVRERAVGADVQKSLTPGQQVVKIVHEELTELMGSGSSQIAFSPRPPTTILLAGRQPRGKTTAAGKLALLLNNDGRQPRPSRHDRGCYRVPRRRRPATAGCARPADPARRAGAPPPRRGGGAGS